MSAAAVSPALQERLATLHKQRDNAPASAEIVAIVEDMLSSMEGDLSQANLKLYSELEALARYIAEAKAEIAALRPEEIRSRHLPTATDELEAIVGATEKATNGILEAVEVIETLVGDMPVELAEKVTGAVTRVYEACNFQDITGQRITKVVKALQHIELKVDSLLAVFGDGLVQNLPAPGPLDDPEEEPRDAADKKLLNGPQLPDDASTQAEIDKLLADFG